MRDAGVTVAGALSPQRTQQFWKTVVDAGVDLFVIRGTTVSAEHVSGRAEPLNLKRFIYELDVPVIVGGCGHLHRGAAPDAHRRGRRAGRLRRRRRAHHPHDARHPRADGHRRSPTSPRPAATTWTSPAAATCTSSPTAAWAVAATSSRPSPAAPTRSCSARRWPGPPTRPAAATTGAPRRTTPSCRAASGSRSARVGPLEEILLGPSHGADGTMNLIGALRRAMATTGYSDLKEFQRVEVVVAPYQRS